MKSRRGIFVMTDQVANWRLCIGIWEICYFRLGPGLGPGLGLDLVACYFLHFQNCDQVPVSQRQSNTE